MNLASALCLVISTFSLQDDAKQAACEHIPYVIEVSEKEGFDPITILSMMYVESRFQKKAVSRSNACGLMQLIPKWNKETVDGKKIKYTCKEIMEPRRNIRLGIAALKRWRVSTGSMDRALCGYNAGNICRKPSKKRADKKYVKNPSKFRYVKSVRRMERKIKKRLRAFL